MDEIGLIVGLGNPGPEYAGTRHNAGFMVIDRLLAGFPAGRFEERHTASSSVWAGKFRGRALLLQKPLTFMNLSGQAVALLARRSGIQPESILVISDDLDLPVGRLRLRNGGADGGHNGLKSIIAELGSSSFRRLRIGIGRPKPGETDSAPHILSLSFDGVRGEVMRNALEGEGVLVSTGSACASHKQKVSPTLRAMGLSQAQADGTVRVSLGAMNTMDEMDEAARHMLALYRMLRQFKRR